MANTARLAVMACLMRGGCDASTTSPGTRGYDNSAANGSIPSSATGHDTGLHFVLGGCTSLLPIVQRNSQKRLADLAVLHHLGQVLCFLCALLPMLCAEPHNRCPLRKRVPRVCARDQRGLAVPMHDRCYCSCGSRPLYGTSVAPRPQISLGQLLDQIAPPTVLGHGQRVAPPVARLAKSSAVSSSG